MPRYNPTCLPESDRLLDDMLQASLDPESDAPIGLRMWLQAQIEAGLMANLDPSGALTVVNILPGGDRCRTLDELAPLIREEQGRLAAGGQQAAEVLGRWHEHLLAQQAADHRRFAA
ncbi:hypothetical protein CKO28_00260 [Rhodovibrio sodomensis]|uniref:Uncharacterized protein n=1 Tax=Rhodovibrio sodomensis TaxID=1088 RepID=A0ABS1D931_9PROT|nr:hypothetical protein [Rhodovibrio sodomensis]MBK1666472.1 hypothetical protein [Rhodovibrio sodomensis]